MNDIQYSTARIWTNEQLAKTVKQCKQQGFIVTKHDGMTTIVNPDADEVVLRSLKSGSGQLVRIDQGYFDPEFEKVYLYLDEQNYVCYAMDYDTPINRQHPNLRRFVVLRKHLHTFFKYYELRFHPYTKKRAA